MIGRDVKPANIMLDDRGEPFLMDFGSARPDGEALITVDGQILGTPAYLTPEQTECGAADARTDVYSFGNRTLRVAHRPATISRQRAERIASGD